METNPADKALIKEMAESLHEKERKIHKLQKEVRKLRAGHVQDFSIKEALQAKLLQAQAAASKLEAQEKHSVQQIQQLKTELQTLLKEQATIGIQTDILAEARKTAIEARKTLNSQPDLSLVSGHSLARPSRDTNDERGSIPGQTLITLGSVVLASGGVYTGQWNSTDQRHGHGHQVFTDGAEYSGTWEYDVRSGFGKLVRSDGSTYLGGWLRDTFSGYGTYAEPDGYRYEGGWVRGQQSGTGVEVWPNGDKFQGEFQSGQKHGTMKCYWADGQKYIGDYQNGAFHGRGTLTWSNGDVYEGEWKMGKRSGKGKLSWVSGDVYTGDFQDDAMTGKGELTWANGEKYIGDFKSNQRTGQGQISWKDGNISIGRFLNGALFGCEEWDNGNPFEGDRIVNTEEDDEEWELLE